MKSPYDEIMRGTKQNTCARALLFSAVKEEKEV
jgi:hypothetical protein